MEHSTVAPLIVGAGGFGRQLADWLLADGCGEAVFLDDAPAAGVIGPLKACGTPSVLGLPRPVYVALGNNRLRCELLETLRRAGCDTPCFISSRAAVSPGARLEPGCLVLPFAYVGAGVTAGAGCILNAGAIVDHNAVLGCGVHVAPGAIVKAGATVADFTKVESGEIIQSPWTKA